MEGYCVYCGQIRIVNADTREKANAIATYECNCEDALVDKKIRDATEVLIEIADVPNMESIDKETIKVISGMLKSIALGTIDAISIKLYGSTLTIKSGDKIKITRKRNYTVNMEV